MENAWFDGGAGDRISKGKFVQKKEAEFMHVMSLSRETQESSSWRPRREGGAVLRVC